MKTSLAHVGSRFMTEAALKNSRAKGSLPISAGSVGTTYKQQQQDESQPLPHADQKKQFQVDYCSEKESWGTSLVVQWLRLCASIAGAWVLSLIKELRSCMLSRMAKKEKKFFFKKHTQFKPVGEHYLKAHTSPPAASPKHCQTDGLNYLFSEER